MRGKFKKKNKKSKKQSLAVLKWLCFPKTPWVKYFRSSYPWPTNMRSLDRCINLKWCSTMCVCTCVRSQKILPAFCFLTKLLHLFMGTQLTSVSTVPYSAAPAPRKQTFWLWNWKAGEGANRAYWVTGRRVLHSHWPGIISTAKALPGATGSI